MSSEKKVLKLMSNKKLVRELIDLLQKEGFKRIELVVGTTQDVYSSYSWGRPSQRTPDTTIRAKWKGQEVAFNTTYRNNRNSELVPAISYNKKNAYSYRKSWKPATIVKDTKELINSRVAEDKERQASDAEGKVIAGILKKQHYPILNNVDREICHHVGVEGISNYIKVKEVSGRIQFKISVCDKRVWVNYDTLTLLTRLVKEGN